MGNSLKKIAISCRKINVRSKCCVSKTVDNHVEKNIDNHITNIIYECHNCKTLSEKPIEVPLD
jgi:hypothetical protein